MGRKKIADTVPANEADRAVENAAVERASSGTKERVLSDIVGYLDDPERPMVRYEAAKNNLANSRNMNVSVAKLYEDGGHKVNVMRYLSARGAFVRLPETPEGVLESCEQLLTFCLENRVPPTLGLFALWNGVTVQRINQVERDTADERSRAVAFCKEVVRNILEQGALDGTVNTLMYFHMQKSQYGFVENQTVTVRHEDNTTEISADEYARRVISLTQGADGVYREGE